VVYNSHWCLPHRLPTVTKRRDLLFHSFKLVQKGGTAKTTTTAALSVLLSRRGTPVHLVDLDPQASLTRAFGIEDDADGFCNALTNRAGLPMKTVAQNLAIVSQQL
jgi:chromosome partitioning protein